MLATVLLVAVMKSPSEDEARWFEKVDVTWIALATHPFDKILIAFEDLGDAEIETSLPWNF
jgi:hypothetical protein